MRLDIENLESTLFDFVEQIKTLIAPEIWENVLLDCSKNEILVLMLLYRNSDVNMTWIAEYVQVPLNTATGIVSRMEKKQMVSRVRSEVDKRVVTIALTEHGVHLIRDIMQQFLRYGERVFKELSVQELELAGKIMDKVICIFREEQALRRNLPEKTVRRILIE